MNILIVGNVLKDIYLNLDERTENFETDRNGTRWLDLSFDASEHHFFNRKSTFGGAAVTLEVFTKLGLKSQVSDFDFSLNANGFTINQNTDIYRYILIANHQISYLSPTKRKKTTFSVPHDFCDLIYIDRSANLDAKNTQKIISYLKSSKKTKLVSYIKNLENPHLNQLIPLSDFIFYENKKIDSPLFKAEKTILLSENCFSYLKVKEYVANRRIDMLTHLSFYAIASATILGSFISGNTVKDSLNFARINVENSRLDNSLTLNEIKENAKDSTFDDLNLIALNLILPPKSILEFDDKQNLSDLKKSANGVILTDENLRNSTENGQNIVGDLIAKHLIPGIKITNENLAKLTSYYNLGIRFASYSAVINSDFQKQCQNLAKIAKKCQLHKFVPILEIKSDKSILTSQLFIDILFEKMTEFDVDFSSCIIKQTKYELLNSLFTQK